MSHANSSSYLSFLEQAVLLQPRWHVSEALHAQRAKVVGRAQAKSGHTHLEVESPHKLRSSQTLQMLHCSPPRRKDAGKHGVM